MANGSSWSKPPGRSAGMVGDPAPAPRLYHELAVWWPLLSPPGEYAEEARFYEHTLLTAAGRSPRTVLELGSGGGNNASYLKRRFDLVLVDRSSEMLDISRTLNPDCEHVQGDMRTVRIGRLFDAVFVHDAIDYMTTAADLRRVMDTAFVHCRPGGVALFCPDHVRETFRPSTTHGGSDGDGRSLRYLEWTWDPDPADATFVADYAYVLRERDGSVRVEHDRHLGGVFARGEWLQWLGDAGFEPRCVPFAHSEVEPGSLDVFVAVRPDAAVPAGPVGEGMP